MQLDDRQAELLKNWIVKQVDDSSDADADVLAEYVLVLVKGNDDLTALRQNCIQELRDFLQDSTETFVDQVISAIRTGAYDPERPQIPPATSSQAPTGPRKRGYAEVESDGAQSGRYNDRANRPVKQARRGGRGGRQAQQPWQQNGMSNITPQDAINAMMALQQAMGLPPLPGFPQQDNRRPKGRCRDYDNKGFCARGASCPYEHGTEAIVVGEQGQNFTRSFTGAHPETFGPAGEQMNGRGRGAGRARGRQGRGNGRRTDISHAGPSKDKSNTSLVVEQIPEDKLNDEAVQDFFSEFGTVTKIDMQPQKRLAVVTFDDWDAANTAYMSPKVVFDNRFVKVFWHKGDQVDTNGHQTEDVVMNEPEIDHEEFARKQSEAQQRHETNKKQREEAQRQKDEINAKLKAMDEERKKFAELLARKAKPAADTDSEQTKGLKAQLAKLEAEAKSLGIDPTATIPENGDSWRGRGGYRGRGRSSTRASYRAAWPSTRGGAVKRLDNRPKTLSLAFNNGTFEAHDEALRQYLLFSDNLEHSTLSRHPSRPDSAMIAFEERYRAENFMAAVKGPNGIPGVGPVEVAWVASTSAPNVAVAASADTTMGDDDTARITTTSRTNGNEDYDIAEDDGWA